MYALANLASILQSAVYLQIDAQYEADYEADDSAMPAELKQWIKDGAAILSRMTEEELSELTAQMKAATDKLGKAGAKHSAETKAHHAAIAKCMGKIAKAAADGQDHCNALMGKDMEDAAQPHFVKEATYEELLAMGIHVDKIDGVNKWAIYCSAPSPITKQASSETAEITNGEQNMDPKDKQQLEKAASDSASSLSKVAELEKGINELKGDMSEGFKGVFKALDAFVEAMKPAPATAQKAARTAVTVTKEMDTQAATEPSEADLAKMSPAERAIHELKKAHQCGNEFHETLSYHRGH
jgi:hypothetical protein